MPNAIFAPEKISEHRSKTPEGYVLCAAVPIARTGVMEYHEGEIDGIEYGAGGVVSVTRDESIFAPDVLASFEGKPVTIDHPDDTLVSPESWAELSVGTMQNVRRGEGEESDMMLADLLITSPKAIEMLEGGGELEVSCGYTATFEQQEAGVARQVGIVGNHVAIVAAGRAGARCAIKDSQPEDKMESPEDKKEVAEEVEGKKPPEATEEKATDEDPYEARFAAIEELLRKLLEKEGEEEVADEDGEDDKKPCADEDDEEDKKVSVGDSKATLRIARLIAPGITAKVGDSRAMRSALLAANLTPDGHGAITAIVGDTAISSLKGKVLEATFRAVGEITMLRNDTKTRGLAAGKSITAGVHDAAYTSHAQKINDANLAYWSTRK